MQKTQKPSNHEPPLSHSTMSMSFLHWGAQNWTQHSRGCPTSAGQRKGTTISLQLLATPLLAQPTTQLPFARRTHQWLSAAHCPQGPWLLFYKAASQPASAALCCSMGLFHPVCWTWVYLRTLLSVHFSSLMWLFWTVALQTYQIAETALPSITQAIR